MLSLAKLAAGVCFLVALLLACIVVLRERAGFVRRLLRLAPAAGAWLGLMGLGLAMQGSVSAPQLGAAAVGLLQVVVLGTVGIAACGHAGQPGLPLSGRLVRQGTDLPGDGVSPRVLATGALVGLAASAWTALLFLATGPRPSAALLRAAESAGQPWTGEVSAPDVALLAQVAVGEELLYRLGLQGFLLRWADRPRHPGRGAVMVTAVVFTLMHAGQVDPDWVKLAQIFPLALALGRLQVAAGTEACIAAHLVFNLLGAAMAPWLLAP